MCSTSAAAAYGPNRRLEVSVEVDGELLGESPLEFSILHRAIRIVVSEAFSERHDAGRADYAPKNGKTRDADDV